MAEVTQALVGDIVWGLAEAGCGSVACNIPSKTCKGNSWTMGAVIEGPYRGARNMLEAWRDFAS